MTNLRAESSALSSVSAIPPTYRSVTTGISQPGASVQQMICPLCSSAEYEEIGALPISTSLVAMGITAPIEQVLETPSADNSRLVECTCGLQYFSPAVVGNATFYKKLASNGYYEPLRWDQRKALEFVRSGQTVLDLGSGSGDFVEASAAVASRSVGIDFASLPASNQPSVRFISGRADLDGDEAERLASLGLVSDLVTAFQLVEHLSAPLAFVQSAANLVSPGGCLIISVPNRLRFEIDPVQALDCPPHHQTRWTVDQLRLLGDLAKLETEAIIAQPSRNPLRIVNRVARRTLRRSPPDWPLPPAARPWPLHRILNGMSLVAVYSRGRRSEP